MSAPSCPSPSGDKFAAANVTSPSRLRAHRPQSANLHFNKMVRASVLTFPSAGIAGYGLNIVCETAS